jgi:pimeloyl-ACP methyl ester carboxylesterase
MKYIVKQDAGTGEEIHLAYTDYGSGQPVILIHGWPLSKEMWEYQENDLVNAGLRVIKYDRRGFGHSSKPWNPYNYDVLAEDLKDIMEQLDLRDAVLVGFSMGGGEVVRYLSNFGSERIAKAVLISAVPPFLLKTPDNPDGVDQSFFDDIMKQIREDRIHFLDNFGKAFFGVNLINHPVSAPLLDYYRMLASVASPRATEQCAISFSSTDFRQDVKAINIPTLIIHGDDDQTVPIKISSDLTAKMIPNSQYIVYKGAPHGLFYTHKDQLNKDLIQFITA